MSQRSRRHTSSRSISTQKRKSASYSDDSIEEKSTIAVGRNWFFQQSPMSQVYYLKITIGLVFGGLLGLFYSNPVIAGNWFIFPLVALGAAIVITRYVLNISKDDLDDLRLITWTGTISMIIAFMVASVLIWNIVVPTHYTWLNGSY